MNKITRDMTMGQIIEVLEYHDISMPFGWEFVLNGLLNQCDYLKVDGFGEQAEFILVCKH